jgi:uncharacterized protein
MRLAAALFLAICMFPISRSKADAPLSKDALVRHFHDEATGELVNAALKGDTAKIDALVGSGANVNRKGDEGLTPLIVAVLANNKKATLILVERGANPNEKENQGNSAVTLAAGNSDPSILEALLKHGGNPDVKNAAKETAIFDAIKYRDLRNVELLVAHGANLNDQSSESRQTPLIRAALVKQYDIVWFLLQSGADPKKTDVWRYTINYQIQHDSFPERDSLAPVRQRVIDWLRAHGAWKKEEWHPRSR